MQHAVGKEPYQDTGQDRDSNIKATSGYYAHGLKERRALGIVVLLSHCIAGLTGIQSYRLLYYYTSYIRRGKALVRAVMPWSMKNRACYCYDDLL